MMGRGEGVSGIDIPDSVDVEPQAGGGYRMCARYSRATENDKYRMESVYYGRTKLADVIDTLKQLFPFEENPEGPDKLPPWGEVERGA